MIRRWSVGVVMAGLVACAPTHQLTDTASDVYNLASANPRLATFITLIEASGLDAKMRASDPVTVLAPNNDALNTLGPDRVRYLLSEAGATELSELMSAHVFPGAYSGEDIARGKLPKSLAGTRVTGTKASDGLPRLEGTGNILESMKGSNGFVHVIDLVLR
ncbi:MAG: fasciclin domain-containing protein [Candidatus Latescibacteria bacterium]|nr:fasciclin domain-containing protein [Candidatus Latescibacterota bacterium]